MYTFLHMFLSINTIPDTMPRDIWGNGVFSMDNALLLSDHGVVAVCDSVFALLKGQPPWQSVHCRLSATELLQLSSACCTAAQRQTAVTAYFISITYCCLFLQLSSAYRSASQWQTAVTAYLWSKQLVLFTFPGQSTTMPFCSPLWPVTRVCFGSPLHCQREQRSMDRNCPCFFAHAGNAERWIGTSAAAVFLRTPVPPLGCDDGLWGIVGVRTIQGSADLSFSPPLGHDNTGIGTPTPLPLRTRLSLRDSCAVTSNCVNVSSIWKQYIYSTQWGIM